MDALQEEDLQAELLKFSGYYYKFIATGGEPAIGVQLGTVAKSQKGLPLYYFDCDGYCKRLLGNAYSIPVVEHLLRPLRDLFCHKTYPNADYQFQWELKAERVRAK